MVEIVPFPNRASEDQPQLPRAAEHFVEAREALKAFRDARGDTKQLLRANKRLEPAIRKFKELRAHDDADAAAMIRWCLDLVIFPEVERDGPATYYGYMGYLLCEVADYLERPEPPQPRKA